MIVTFPTVVMSKKIWGRPATSETYGIWYNNVGMDQYLVYVYVGRYILGIQNTYLT